MFDDLFFRFALDEEDYRDDGNLSVVNLAALYDLGFYVDWDQYDNTKRRTRRGRIARLKSLLLENTRHTAPVP